MQSSSNDASLLPSQPGDDMSTCHREQSFAARLRRLLYRPVRSAARPVFDVLVYLSSACHLGNCVGFAADEEVLQRYLRTRR
jgi:hypothetical protein